MILRSGNLLSAGRRGAPWLLLAAGLILAIEPVWWRLVFGFYPTLDDLLNIRCRPW